MALRLPDASGVETPELSSLRSWSGGLRKDLDPYNLQSTMLADICDMEVRPGGSVCTRRPLEAFTRTPPPPNVCSVWGYQSKSGADYVMIATEDGQVLQIVNGPGPIVKSRFPKFENPKCCPHAWQANGLLYVSDGNKVLEWDGVSDPKDVTTQKIHDNIADESDTKMDNRGVPASCVAINWSEAVWIAQPTTDYGEDEDAVWFSGQLGKYDELDGAFGGQRDYFTKSRLVAQTDALGDDIVSLVPCGSNLMVFKHGSTHAISATGDDLSAFAIKEVSRDFGASGPKAAGCSLGQTWFYDARQGPMVITPEGTQVVGTQLGDVARRNLAPEKTAVGFCGRKVYFSIAEGSKERNDVTYVYDQETRTWSCMSVGFDCFYPYCPLSGRSYCLGVTSSPCSGVVWLDGDDTNDSLVDDFGCTKKRYYPYVQTAWFDGQLPALSKNWIGLDAQIELYSEPVCLASSAVVDWRNTTSNVVPVEFEPDPGDCLTLDDSGCFVQPTKCYETIAPGTAPRLVRVEYSETATGTAESTVREVRVRPCSSKSAGVRLVSGKSGRWCLRQVFVYYTNKRILT